VPSLAGRTALVTGASSGIGRAIAVRLAEQGVRIYGVGRNIRNLDATVGEIHARGGSAEPIIADLTAGNDLANLVRSVTREITGLDILVHAAGVISNGYLQNTSVESFDLQFQANTRAPYLLTQALLPLLKAARGEIVFINSSAGLNARTPQQSQYAATKHALKAIADTLREEVNSEGVRVLSVYPGRTATPLQQTLFQAENKTYHPELLLQPEDVATVVVSALSLPRTAEVTDINIRSMNKF